MKRFLQLIVTGIALSAIGIASAQQDLTAAQVKSRLEAAGYTNVQNVKKEGDHFDAMATDKSGKRMALGHRCQDWRDQAGGQGTRRMKETSTSRGVPVLLLALERRPQCRRSCLC
jgi:hypothetical protein